MKRIGESGCGWLRIEGSTVEGSTASYYCSGLPKLDIVFGTTSITGSTIEERDLTYDHFDRVPQKIEGFRMTLSPILNMSGTTSGDVLEVPELTCRVDVDPFDELPDCVLNTDPALSYNALTANTGFLDLYNNVDSYHEQFYVTVDGTTHHMVNDSDYPAYTVDDQMGPGILEPMLNTQFGPVAVDMPPTPDLTTDALIYSLAGLQSWRHTIDGRVSNNYINAVDYGLIGLDNARNQRGPCGNFNISVENQPAEVLGIPRHFDEVTPTYSVGSGIITLNGVPGTTISGVSNIAAPFSAYLDVSEDGAVVMIVSGSPYLSPEMQVAEHTYIYIGSVRRVDALQDFPIVGSTTFSLFEINQGDCIDQVRTEYGSNAKAYPGPFLVTGSTLSDASYMVTGFDLVGTTHYAGKIYLDGKFLDWGPEDDVDMTGTGAFVYAHIEVAGVGSDTVSVAGCTYDNTDEFVLGNTNNIGYTIRLARDLATGPEQIHYGDIYLYTKGSTSSGGGGVYTGPFHVLQGPNNYTVAIDGIFKEGDSGTVLDDAAGKVFLNGKFAGVVAGGTASFAQSDIPADVYVSFPITASTESTAIDGYTVGTRYYGVARKDSTETTIWYNVRLARLTGEPTTASWHIEQTHFGDIYIDLPVGSTTTIVGGTYTGPFRVDVDANGTASISCPDCTPVTGKTVNGQYIINGTTIKDVYDLTGISVGTTGTNTVILQIAPGEDYPKLAKTVDTAPNVYNVLLAQIRGGTAYQMQYGYIHVDGRWS